MAHFQGRTVSFREGKKVSHLSHLTNSKGAEGLVSFRSSSSWSWVMFFFKLGPLKTRQLNGYSSSIHQHVFHLNFPGCIVGHLWGFPRAPVILRERQERWRSLQSWRKVAMGQVIPNRFHSQVFGSVLNSWHPLPRHKISLDERCWYQKIIARYRTCTQIFGSVLLLMAEFRRENQLIYRERPIYLQGFYTSQVVGIGISEPSTVPAKFPGGKMSPRFMEIFTPGRMLVVS